MSLEHFLRCAQPQPFDYGLTMKYWSCYQYLSQLCVMQLQRAYDQCTSVEYLEALPLGAITERTV